MTGAFVPEPARRAWFLLAACILAACQAGQSTAALAADPRHPEVVELFQSQGCSSCPPANRNVMPLAGRPDVLVLSWQVTYWDYLGWKDSFADPAFTARQHAYARSLGHDGVWTPQVVINGRGDVVGSDRSQLGRALYDFDRGAGGPSLVLSGEAVRVDGIGKNAVLTMIRYDPRILQVPIRAGENGGATLPHRNVVREVMLLGVWNGGSHAFHLPGARQTGLKIAVLLQQGPAGPILAAVHD
ncbi:MAG: DUF1223 domain-containing protein [Novosphingobium sp.]